MPVTAASGGGQKKASGLLELELEVMSCPVPVLGNQTQVDFLNFSLLYLKTSGPQSIGVGALGNITF